LIQEVRFLAKIYQIAFGSARTRWELKCSPRPSGRNKGRGREQERGKEGREKGREGKGLEPPHDFFARCPCKPVPKVFGVGLITAPDHIRPHQSII